MTRSPLVIALDRRLTKWRKREQNDDGPLWHGINHVRQGLGDKAEVRAALLELVDAGRVERFECGSGVYWRGGFRDVIDVRAVRP